MNENIKQSFRKLKTEATFLYMNRAISADLYVWITTEIEKNQPKMKSGTLIFATHKTDPSKSKYAVMVNEGVEGDSGRENDPWLRQHVSVDELRGMLVLAEEYERDSI